MKELQELSKYIGITALDIGSRGGVCNDLNIISSGVDYYGFEPDKIECDRLNSDLNKNSWRSLTYLPFALDKSKNEFDLNLYKHRGCSSKLTAVKEIGARYSRGHYYELEGTARVKTVTLDSVVNSLPIHAPSFMKIDVQGMEMDVFAGATDILKNSIVAIRTEVNFLRMYENLPLISDIDNYLRNFGFEPMQFIEFHEWRRLTKNKLPKLAESNIPYSKGQMIHGDILYLLPPEYFNKQDDESIKREIKLALIAICYDLYDHAYVSFKKKKVRSYCMDQYNIDPIPLVEKISKLKSKNYSDTYNFIRKIIKKLNI